MDTIILLTLGVAGTVAGWFFLKIMLRMLLIVTKIAVVGGIALFVAFGTLGGLPQSNDYSTGVFGESSNSVIGLIENAEQKLLSQVKVLPKVRLRFELVQAEIDKASFDNLDSSQKF